AGVVATPPTNIGILPGVTRARVLATCAAAGIAAEERRLTIQDVLAADEIFVTSAVRGVVAVTRLDGVARSAGPVTARIIEGYLAGLRQQTVGGSNDPF
ncbi:MAG TPA: aminotransferase class IV, partial [Kofleriaceae bacterium]